MGGSGTLHHLAERDALQHHLCCLDPLLELLGTVLRLELDEVLVRLGWPGIVAVVPLASGGRLGATPPPSEVSLGHARKRDQHVPQCARGLEDLPLAVVGHEADLGMLATAVVGHADLPSEVHRADLPLLVLGLLGQRDVRQQAPQDRGLGQLDQLGQLGRLCLAGCCIDVALLDGGHVDRAGGRVDLDVVLPVGGLTGGVVLIKPVDDVPGDDPPVSRGPVRLREAVRLVPHDVDAILVDKDGVLQLLELCPELEGLVGGGGVGETWSS
jgi:hypothetical protein